MDDAWDPRQEDFKSSFNTYDRGPGKNLPQKGEGSASGAVQLFIYGVPREVTEDGLRNMFVKAGNVLRVKKPPPKSESQEVSFAFVTMSNVREAEEAIRRYNQFKIDRFTLKVQVAKSEEQKKKELQQKQEDEEFYSSLQSFKGKSQNIKSSSDTDSDLEKLNSAGGVTNGISQKPKPAAEPAVEKGKGRGQVLEELSGLYGSGASSLWQLRLPRQPNSGSHAVTPGGDADRKKKLDERFQPTPVNVKKLAPGEMYNVEDLTITVSDPCDQAQHSVKTKGEEIKLTHAARKPYQLKALLNGNTSTHGKGMGRGYDRRGGGYKQANGPEVFGGRERFHQGHRGGYQQGQGHRGQREPRDRGFDRYDAYTAGYQNYNDRFRPLYGGQMPVPNHGGPMPMYNPAPTFSPYGANVPPMGMMGHPAGGYPQMGPFTDHSYLLTPAQPVMNQSMNQSMHLPGYIQQGPVTMPGTMSVTSAPHSPAVSTAGEKPEGQKCSVCEKMGHSRCGRCKVPYCGKECQKADWPRHKIFCKDISQGREQTEEFEKKFDVTIGDEMIENMKGLIERYTGEQVEITKKSKPPPLQKSDGKSSEIEARKDSTVGKTQDAGLSREKTNTQGRDNRGGGSDIQGRNKKGGGSDTQGRDNRGRDRDRPPDRDHKQNERKRKGGDSLCHNCHKPGHFSKECPDKLAVCRGGGSGVTCHYCRETGHYKADCPRNQEKKGRGRDQRSDRRSDNQNRAALAPVDNDEANWDEPAPAKIEKPVAQPKLTAKPLAQSTPSNTPAKPAVQSPPRTTEYAQQIVSTAALPLNTEVLVVVTEVVSPAMIWCQIVDRENVEPLQDIMGKMAEKYSTSKPDITTVHVGQYCGVQFSLDQHWYRGRVTSKNPCVVHFIDFGNSEQRSLTDLRQIEDAWLKHPAQVGRETHKAVHCYLEDVSPPGSQTGWSGVADKVQAIVASNVPYKVTAKERKESEPGFAKFGVVMINEANENIADKLLAAGLGRKKQSVASGTSVGVKKPEEKSSPMLMKDVGCVAKEMKVEQVINIMITDVMSPTNFTVQLMEEERITAFQKFSEQLKMVENEPPYKPGVGELVVAKFIDGRWYRAEVLSVANSQVDVTYIDFGNSETVDLNNMRKPKPSFKSVPAQAMKCSVNGYKPSQSDEDSKVLLPFVELVSLAAPVKLKAIVKGIIDDVVMLELFSADGKSVNRELEKLAYPKDDAKETDMGAKKTQVANGSMGAGGSVAGEAAAGPDKESGVLEGELPMNGTAVLALITEIRSNDSFYVQLLDDTLKLQAIMTELNDPASKIEEVKPCDVKVGEYVAALFDDGGCIMWYRAKVVEVVSADKVKVLYIDFGNWATVSNTMVKKLDFEMKHLPAIAVHCELLGSNGSDAQVTEDFKCMLNQTVNVKAVQQRKDRYIVDLKLTTDNVTSVSTVLGLDTSKLPDTSEAKASVSDQLISYPVYPLPLDGSQVSAIVVHVERLDLFCIQPLAEEYQQQLPVLMNELQENCSKNLKPYTPRDGECVAAQFNDGTCTLWYRAKSLGQDQTTRDKFKVEFVDYGNTDSATKDMIQALDPKLAQVPAIAVKCKLSGCTGKEKKEIVEEFRSVMTGAVPLKIRALKLHNDVYEVEMNLDSDKVDMTDVAEILGLKAPAVQAAVVNNVETAVAGAKPKTTESKAVAVKPKARPVKDSPAELKTIQCEVTLEPRKLHQVELPLDGSTIKGAVVFIESLSSFFIQLQDQTYQDGLTQMMTELNESLTKTKPHAPETGETVAALYSEGQGAPAMWYRARVENIDNDTLKVFFVDYGNTEQVRKEEVQMLLDKFLTLPQLAVRCQLPGSQGIEDAELLTGFACIMNQPISVKALKRMSGGYEIDLITDTGMSVAETLCLSADGASPGVSDDASEAGKTVETAGTKPAPAAQKELEVFKLPLDGSKVPGAVMAIESLQVFHVQILNTELEAQLGVMMVELQEYCSAAVRSYRPTAGEVVAAMFTDGGETLWYRARVRQILGEGKQLVVFFVDYGNTEIVEQNEVCQLDEKFLQLPQGSVTCKLVGSMGTEDKNMAEEFQLVLKVRLNIKAVAFTNGIYAIELYLDDGVNINEQLGLGEGSVTASASGPISPSVEQPQLTVRTTPPKPEALPRKSVSPQQNASDRKVVFTQTLPTYVPKVEEFQVMMTSVMTPDLFHAQVLDAEHDYRTDLALQTHRMMLECESELGQEDIQYEQGELVCSKFISDNSWYRASILKIFPDKTAQVEYVDYGNTELVPLTMIRPVTNDYIELPILAFKCKLSGVYPTGENWSSESADKLKSFLNKCLEATLVTIHKDVYELKLVERESSSDVGETLVKAGVASRNPSRATRGRAASPGRQPAAESLSDTEKLQRENELMKQQLAAMQAQMAELLKQKN